MENQNTLAYIKSEVTVVIDHLSTIFCESFNSPKIISSKKNFKDLVTGTDQKIEREFKKWLDHTFPQHGFIGEETVANLPEDTDWVWCIDPIDGTTNFIHSLPHCAIMISVLHKNIPVLAWIVFPLLEQTYFAEKGKGAYLNNIKLPHIEEISLSEALLTTLDLDDMSEIVDILTPLWKIVSGVRMEGCAALVYCNIASGHMQIGILPHSYIWEYGAGALLVEETGGSIARLDNKMLDFKDTKCDIVVTSSDSMMNEVKKLLI